MSFEEGFIKDAIKRFQSYKELGDKTFNQLEDKHFFYQPSSESNSIAIIIQHLYGNMLSRFTNFLAEDGEKSWRNRDAEFESVNISKEDLLAFWNSGWNCVFNALNDLHPEDLVKTVYIRSEPMTAYDAILRQLAHYPYHIGQIVFLGKLIKNTEWQTLSIPKGQSKQFNERMTQKKNQSA